MLKEDQKKFIEYWEANRDREKRFLTQFLVGIPVGLVFAIPVVLILFSGRLWYKRADMVANADLNPFVLLVAIVLIVAFVAVFYKRHQWDMKEQQYLEFKSREQKENDSSTGHKQQL